MEHTPYCYRCLRLLERTRDEDHSTCLQAGPRRKGRRKQILTPWTLYTSATTEHWIASTYGDHLYVFPALPGGWRYRTRLMSLPPTSEHVASEFACGTGWPGTYVGENRYVLANLKDPWHRVVAQTLARYFRKGSSKDCDQTDLVDQLLTHGWISRGRRKKLKTFHHGSMALYLFPTGAMLFEGWPNTLRKVTGEIPYSDVLKVAQEWTVDG